LAKWRSASKRKKAVVAGIAAFFVLCLVIARAEPRARETRHGLECNTASGG
jgi:hypothetical protein